jgi:hypothetical protein
MIVRLFKTVLSVLLALAWVPLMAHCQLESITGLELLRCQSAGETSAPGSSHCDDESCCTWESGQYHSPQNQPLISSPVHAVASPLALSVPDHSLPADPGVSVLTAAPPEIPNAWQFSLRAALPVRAPSFAS